MSQTTVNINIPFGGQSGIIPGGAQNISLTIAGARGGSGGFDSGGPGGGAGSGRSGSFSIPTSSSNRSWSGFPGAVGSNGPGGSGAAVGGPGGSLANQGSGSGGKGGDDGTSGWSGCGAGGGAASVFYLAGARAVTAGGGGGGGGGSFSCGGSQRPGGTGGTAGGFSNSNSVSLSNGGGGANKGGGDGGGGGGGGGGHGGGGGGGAGTDCNNGGGGGGGGTSRYRSSIISFLSQSTNNSSGSMSLSYDLKVAEINTFTTNKTSIINNGETATLSWSVSDSESQSINQGVGSVSAVDSEIVSPTSSVTYTLTAVGQAGNDSKFVTITVYQPTVANLRADGQNDSTSITRGQQSNLDWTVSGDANSASINQGIGPVLISSNTDVSPEVTTTYTLSASGPGGSDTDDVTVVVNQPPELSFNPPLQINYGDTVEIDVSYRYATNGVNIAAIYTQRNPLTGNFTTVSETISLPGTSSDESGAEVTNTATFNIPWTNNGTFAIAFTTIASGAGGSVSSNDQISVYIDQQPDNITLPENKDELPLDQIAAPDESLVLSDPIFVTDIDIPVEIKASDPIQVRFDDDDPDIESNWNDLRNI